MTVILARSQVECDSAEVEAAAKTCSNDQDTWLSCLSRAPLLPAADNLNRGLGGYTPNQEHRRVLHGRPREPAGAGQALLIDGKRIAAFDPPADTKADAVLDAGNSAVMLWPRRRPRPSGIRRMDADPGYDRLDRQLRARRHDDDGLSRRVARAGPRL